MVDIEGGGLLFLVSQPRAGSTLLQRMLGANPDIFTIQESWIALYPLLALTMDGVSTSSYLMGESYLRAQFLESLEGGRNNYLFGLREMLTYLYNRALLPNNQKLFLDKSTRYHLILPELLDVFPKAQILILFRNPLAVLISMITTWTKDNWFGLSQAQVDLMEAPRRLQSAVKDWPSRFITLRFEDLVSYPRETVDLLCDRIGVPFREEMLHPGAAPLPVWTFGDQKSVYRYDSPREERKDAWQTFLEHPQVWRFAADYLASFKKADLKRMGYDKDELSSILSKYRPPAPALWPTFSLRRIMAKPNRVQNWRERILMRIQRQVFTLLNRSISLEEDI